MVNTKISLNFKHDNRLAVDPFNNFSRKQLVELKKQGYDLDWLKEIQPQGGITFSEKKGIAQDGYFECLEVYSYDKRPAILWMEGLMINENTIASMDIGTAEKREVVLNLNKSMNEMLDQQVNAKQTTERVNANAEYSELLEYSQDLTRNGEVAKKIRTRIFVYGSTLEELERRVKDLRNQINNEGYKVVSYLCEPRVQLDSLFQNLDQQRELLNWRRPFSIKSRNIGGGVPFHHQSLLDPHGYPYGTTFSGGSFVFDPFFKSKERMSYNGALFGTMGSGKSTILKMIVENMLGSHNLIRGIDIVGDFKGLTQEHNGAYIPLDGTGGVINPLEVLGTILTEDGSTIDELKSFMNHISKVSDQFRFLNPNFNESELQELRLYLLNFYISIGLVPSDYETNPSFKITGLGNEKYPIMSDLLNYLMNVKLDQSVTPSRVRILEKLQLSLKDIVTNYGSVFNGHSAFNNISDIQMVFFGAGDLRSQSEEVFKCQLYTALTMIWNQSLQNGLKMRRLLKSKQISVDDIRFCEVILDECHNIINTNAMFAVEYVSKFEREMRKFLAGVWFATQSPEEMVPEGASGEDEATIKSVLQFTQYKFLLKTDPATIPAVKRLLGDAITTSEYERLPSLETGQCLCNFGHNNNYTVIFEPDKEQLERFDGGR